MGAVRIRWRSAARVLAVAGGCLLALRVLPGLLEAPEPPPLGDDVGLPRAGMTMVPRIEARGRGRRPRVRRSKAPEGRDRSAGRRRVGGRARPDGESGSKACPRRAASGQGGGGDGQQCRRAGLRATTDLAGRIDPAASTGAARPVHTARIRSRLAASPAAADRCSAGIRSSLGVGRVASRMSSKSAPPLPGAGASGCRRRQPSPHALVAAPCRSARMSASCSSTQSPGLREKMISFSRCARRRRSSGSIVRAR